MLNLAGPYQQLLGGQPLSNESMNINLDIDNLDFIHLDFHHLETLVHKLPNSQKSYRKILCKSRRANPNLLSDDSNQESSMITSLV